jgi:hypothetical protein
MRFERKLPVAYAAAVAAIVASWLIALIAIWMLTS